MTDVTRNQPRGTAKRRNAIESRSSLVARRNKRARRRTYRAI